MSLIYLIYKATMEKTVVSSSSSVQVSSNSVSAVKSITVINIKLHVILSHLVYYKSCELHSSL